MIFLALTWISRWVSNSFFQLHLLLFIIATVYLSTNAVSTFEQLEVTVKRDRENLIYA